MTRSNQSRVAGFNHVALAVCDIDEALELCSAPQVLRGMALAHLRKPGNALLEPGEKVLAPD